MGQYYKPALIGPRGGVKWLYSHEYGHNGLKLMEHSYLGNTFVNAVLSQILDHPMKVAWVGDYSEDPWSGTEAYQQKVDKEEFMPLFNKLWIREEDDKTREKLKIHPEPLNMPELESFTGWYLVNHTLRQYVDLKAYAERNKWHEEYDWNGKHYAYDMCINPLPLLTACGNNRGGGDYYDSHPDFDKVGSWAFDLIEFTNSKPEGFEEVSFHFTEQEEAAQ